MTVYIEGMGFCAHNNPTGGKLILSTCRMSGAVLSPAFVLSHLMLIINEIFIVLSTSDLQGI